MESIGVIIVRDWLNKYRGTLLDIEAQEEQLTRLTNRLEQVSSPKLTDMPRSPSPAQDRISDAIARKDQLAARIGEQLAFVRVTRMLVEEMLDCCNPKERTAIRLHDLDGMEWSEVMPLLFKVDEMKGKADEYSKALHNMYRYRRNGIAKLAARMERTDGKTLPTLADVAKCDLKKFFKT